MGTNDTSFRKSTKQINVFQVADKEIRKILRLAATASSDNTIHIYIYTLLYAHTHNVCVLYIYINYKHYMHIILAKHQIGQSAEYIF